MASVRRKPGTRFWVCCYSDNEGVQRQRSSKTTNRGEAQKLAETYEAAYRKRMSETQVRRVMAGIFEDLHGESLCHFTLDRWLTQWLVDVKAEVEPRTYDSYETTAENVRKFAPKMCEQMLDRVTSQQILELRNAMAAVRSPVTTNHNLKIFRQSLKTAWIAGLIAENPAARVKNVKDDSAHEEGRRPFTLDEINRLLAVADEEWRGMIFAGIYTAGQRLGDIVAMTAGQVDLAQRTVTFRATEKTGRAVIVPIVDAWMKDLRPRVSRKKPDVRLFPRAATQYASKGGKTGLVSRSFRRLLSHVGMATNPSVKQEGTVEGRRRVSALSFHSFRHTATSLLKNSGVSDSVVMDIVGHESQAVSRNYTHIDEATKRAALETLPEISAKRLR